MSLLWVLLIIFRLLDELIFIGYRKSDIKGPLFVISSPRSGTTYLQNLMAIDEGKFNSIKLYHTIFPSITFFKIISLFAFIDNRIGRPFEQLIVQINKFLFKGWDGIHPLGFNKNEEDEGLWFFNFTSPALSIITPYVDRLQYLNIYDKLPAKIRKANNRYYRNTLLRMNYSMADDNILLVKSVMSSGRIKEITKLFPNAFFICLDRNPLKTIPSYISMFSASWNIIAAHASTFHFKMLGQTAIDFYNYSNKMRKLSIKKDKLIEIKYDDLISDPLAQIKKIYEYFNIELAEGVIPQMQQQINSANRYKSKHSYSLEQYGWTEKEMVKALNGTH